MFQDAGKKIQGLINTFFTLSCILLALAGIGISEMSDSTLAGVIYFAAGCFGCWVSLLALYAFASLVVDTAEIKRMMQQQMGNQSAHSNQAPVQQPPASQAGSTVFCKSCGKQNNGASQFCAGCGSNLI